MFKRLQKALLKMPNEISIVIPTYNNVEFLEECILSVMSSANKCCEYEILLGIDNCIKTLDFVGTNKLFKNDCIKIHYFPKNVGPYVVRNSLAAKANYDNLLFFDSDDVMMEHMIPTLMENFEGKELLKFKFYNFEHGKDYKDINNLKLSKRFGHGVFLIKKLKFYKMNGFFGWKCGADTEFGERYEGQGNVTSLIDVPLFYRRYHDSNITRAPITAISSKLRTIYAKVIVDNQINKKWDNPKTPPVFESNVIVV